MGRAREAEERPPRGSNDAQQKLQNGPQRSKTVSKRPRNTYHEIPANTQEPSDPQPRHGGGIGRRPLAITHAAQKVSKTPQETCKRPPQKAPSGKNRKGFTCLLTCLGVLRRSKTTQQEPNIATQRPPKKPP
eukprot:8214462-Pyramimonas_sp.AAC.1